MKTNTRAILALGTVLGLCAVSYFVGVVRAGGAPTMHPLVYSGTLLDNTGHAVTSAHNIGLTLWDDATMTGGAHQACNVPATSMTPVNGRFSITLDTTTCVAAVRANPDLWVAIDLDGAPLPRTHLGAVPYAIEATHATNADSASTTSRHVVTLGAASESVGGTFCDHVPIGSTDPGGYPGVRGICGTLTGCHSASAHVCSIDEVTRTVALGTSVPFGRLRGPYAQYGGLDVNDCSGWHFAVMSAYSHTWSGSLPEITSCGTPADLLCCD
jgi:hypothetical protein